MSTKDVIKNSFMEAFSANNSLSASTVVTIILSMAVAVIMGMFIYFVYKKLFAGIIYSRSFATTLVGMTVLTCMVTLAISTNIVISLGMVGALSIVRYRTAVKDPMDLLYLFWAITTGITTGASLYVLTLATAFVMVAVIFFLGRRQDKSKIYIVVIHYTGDAAGDRVIQILHKIRHNIKSRTMRRDQTELAVEVLCKGDDSFFAEQIREVEGVSDVTMIQYNGEYHG
ncbi:MAG: DUF4956 domain-containing protein [Lachnospiraceae bacterium]|nr:DUF4956 domain-containing protein [Lachnospiraceae bacterium]